MSDHADGPDLRRFAHDTMRVTGDDDMAPYAVLTLSRRELRTMVHFTTHLANCRECFPSLVGDPVKRLCAEGRIHVMALAGLFILSQLDGLADAVARLESEEPE